MQKIAEKRGGRCLSEIYVNTLTKLLWECSEGHQWETTPAIIIKGRWCPHCGGRAKLTIQEMQRIAKDRGGRCLSKTYINSYSKLIWECARGHRWQAMPTNIKSGSWCPFCARNKKHEKIAIGGAWCVYIEPQLKG